MSHSRSAAFVAAAALSACHLAPAAGAGRAPVAPFSSAEFSLDGSASTQTVYDVAAARWPFLFRADRVVALSDADRRDGPIGVYTQLPGGGQPLFTGGADVLRTLGPAQVARVMRLSAVEEGMRFGRHHSAGAVVVVFRR